MRSNKMVHLGVSVAIAVAVLVCAMQPGAAAVPFDDPPSWVPPEIYKLSTQDQMFVGDQVRFTITVANPSPEAGVTWLNVQVTDVISPELQIDSVVVTPPADDVTITDNTVVVTVNSLAATESFIITIDCTLLPPGDRGEVIVNEASVEYKDPGGNLKPAITVDEPVEVTMRGWGMFLPAVYQESDG